MNTSPTAESSHDAVRAQPNDAPATRGNRARRFLAILRRSPAGAVGIFGVTVAAICAIFAPIVAPHDPLATDIRKRLMPPAWQQGGDVSFLLGTDQLGRDVLSRVIYGARASLLVGVTAVVVAAALGAAVGILAAYYGGIVDEILMRIADVRLNIPLILILISILAIIGPGLINVIIILAITEWVIYARVIRGEAQSIRRREFVVACEALGGRPRRVMVRHMWPAVRGLVIVLASVEVGQLIILESTLGFLGLGVPPPTASWGNMLGEGRDYLGNAWWLATFPGIALTVTVISLTLVGDSLRDWFDPYNKNRRTQ